MRNGNHLFSIRHLLSFLEKRAAACFCCCPIAKRGGDKVVELQLLYDKSNLYQRQSQVSFSFSFV
jgi:hypothetical protein